MKGFSNSRAACRCSSTGSYRSDSRVRREVVGFTVMTHQDEVEAYEKRHELDEEDIKRLMGKKDAKKVEVSSESSSSLEEMSSDEDPNK